MNPRAVYLLTVLGLCILCPALVGFVLGAGLIFAATWMFLRVLGG